MPRDDAVLLDALDSSCQRRRVSFRNENGSGMPADRGHEGQEVVQVVLQDVLHDNDVRGLVAVDDDVAEAGHVAQRAGHRRRQPSPGRKEIEQGAIGLGLAQTLVRDDVGRDVQGGLDRDLEGVLDEPPLTDVGSLPDEPASEAPGRTSR